MARVKMTFSGNNLQRVYDSLELAEAELHNMIATCPDVLEHADAVEAYEAERVQVQVLRGRIARKLKTLKDEQ